MFVLLILNRIVKSFCLIIFERFLNTACTKRILSTLFGVQSL